MLYSLIIQKVKIYADVGVMTLHHNVEGGQTSCFVIMLILKKT